MLRVTAQRGQTVDHQHKGIRGAHKIPELSNCVAHTPPPAAANGAPKLACDGSTTVQPLGVLQSPSPSTPVCAAPARLKQPVSVWSAIWFCFALNGEYQR